jgi:hypothetical protein
MADLRISELAALAGVNLTAGDFLAIADTSASESKKIAIEDAIGYGVTLIADATIPGAKILFNAGQIAGSKITSSSITATELANDCVTSAKLADGSTVSLVTTLPAVGAYIGQLALDTDNNYSIYCWDGSSWVLPKASGSINAINGSTTGAVNIVATSSGDTVTISATLDNTTAAAQFLAGPTAAAGSVGYRTLTSGDLPTATTTAKGAVQVNGEGLRMDGSIVEIDNDVSASGGTFSVVNYNAKGLVTDGRAIGSADIPVATAGSTGAISPGSGLTVTGAGQLNHSNNITASTATKVTFDAEGHITAGSALADTDIPNLPASKLTSGTISTSVIGNNSITGTKLANAATVKFGGAGSTAGVVTFPTPDFQGQYFFDALNGDLYLYDGAAWQPITITSGELVYGGTYNAITNQIKTVTAAGGAAGLTVGQPLPNASASNLRYYVVVADSGTGTAPAPTVSLAPPDMLVSSGTTWDLIDISNAIAGQTATNISFTPYSAIAATNVQTAIQELEDEKLSKSGGTITGVLEIGTAGSLVFEGSTADTNETTIAVTNPTADRTITFPDVSGNVVTTGDTGSVTNTMLAGSIADTKLNTISTVGKVSNSATTAVSTNIASTIVLRDASGNFSAGTITAIFNSTTYLGTTALPLNRSSANQPLTGISSITLAGSTSGNTTIQPSAIASGTITFPSATGTIVTTGDTGSVTSLMIADGTIVDGDISATASIADTKLATISTASKVNCTALTGTIPSTVLGNSTHYVGTTAVALNRASANQALTGISSIAFPGATSGTITVTPVATAGATAITLPATTGTLITTGDTGTVTNTMLAGSIADTKLSTISTAGKVSNSATTATNLNTASAIVARDVSGDFAAGTITAALTGNASTATTLQTARTIQGVSFNGSADITVVTAGTGISVAGTAVANTGVLSVNGSTGAVTNVAVINTAQSFSAAQRGTVSAQGAVSGTVTLDFATANNFSMTLPAGGAVTLANPSNLTAGQSGAIVITQNGTTAATVAYGANWKFSGGTPTMSAGLGSVSTLVYYVESASRITAQLLTNVA